MDCGLRALFTNWVGRRLTTKTSIDKVKVVEAVGAILFAAQCARHEIKVGSVFKHRNMAECAFLQFESRGLHGLDKQLQPLLLRALFLRARKGLGLGSVRVHS